MGQRSPLPYPWYGVFKKVYQVGVNMHYLVWRSHKSAAEVTIALSLVWDFQKGISCRGKYVLFGLVWWSPKSAAKVTIAMYLVWSFQKGISCMGKYRLFRLPPLEVTNRGHHDQLQRSPKSAAEVTIALSLVWDFQKGIISRGNYALFGLVWFGGQKLN